MKTGCVQALALLPLLVAWSSAAVIPGSLLVSTNNFFQRPNALLKVNPNTGAAVAIVPFPSATEFFDASFDAGRGFYFVSTRATEPAEFRVSTISAFGGAVLRNLTAGPSAVVNLQFDPVSGALFGVYQRDGTVVRVDVETGRLSRVGKFPASWCVLRDSGAIDHVQRVYYSSLEDDEGWHQLLAVRIDNGNSTTTKLARGLQPLVVVRLPQSSTPLLLGFDSGSLFSVDTKNGAVSPFMAGLEGGPAQGGLAFATIDGRALLFVAFVSLGKYSLLTIDIGARPPVVVSKFPLADDVRFLAYFPSLT